MNLIIALVVLGIAGIVAWVSRALLPTGPLRGWLLSLFPATSFTLILLEIIGLGGEKLTLSRSWIPSLGLDVSLYLDGLSGLFALLVVGIGTLIMIYAGYYFADDAKAGRFFAYLFLFMGSMLGLVLAGDVLTLFIFWEGTSITSFLLVAYKSKYESARNGAFKALFITGGGGIALLAGLLFVGYVAGGTDFKTILAAGDLLRAHPFYLAMLGLVAFGAFTKSAQVPVHFWLPDAMSAPTPASAFLHSATMVKAGIYLLARLNPALGNTEAWFWLLSVVGLATMLTGAYLGTKQADLKGLLAYSTISQLGILVMLVGQDTEIAFKALIVGIVAHALYKSALFMLIGTVDVMAGTRDIGRLGGLRREMPLTFGLVSIAALSLAGLPPLFGFLAKETLLATAVHPSLPVVVSWLFAAIIVVAAAFKLVQAGLITIDLFTGERRDRSVEVKRPPPLMLLPAAIPALLSLSLGIMPEPQAIVKYFGKAAEASYGAPVKVSFALWTGLNIPLLLSAIAIGSGVLLFWQRVSLIGWQKRFTDGYINTVLVQLFRAIDRGSRLVIQTQTGQLRLYLSVIMLVGVGLAALFSWSSDSPMQQALNAGSLNPLQVEFDIIRLIALLATVSAAVATVLIKRDFFAVLALGASGLGMAIYMAVEPAPDVALVQIVVDILATLILILAIGRLPRPQRLAAQMLNRGINWANLGVATAGGLLVSMISYAALVSRPRPSIVSPFYIESSKKLTGASDIVGAIIVDFRALDTLIEIAVFSLAGLGIFTLLRFATKTHKDGGEALQALEWNAGPIIQSFGVGGKQTSTYLHVIGNIMLPITLMIGAIHMIYGHDQPGDGFTAGVIISLGIGLKYVIFGFRETRRRLWWLHSESLIGLAILLVLFNGAMAAWLNGAFLSPLDYGAVLGLPLPAGVKFSSGFLFEVAIAMAVLGSVSLMLDTLGRPAIDVATLDDRPENVENRAQGQLSSGIAMD